MSARRLAVLVLLLVLALTGCAGSEQASGPAAAPSAEPSVAPSAAPADEPTSEPTESAPVVEPDDAQVVAITVAGGQITGDTGRVEVAMGATVRLSVTSDTADEIHVHGFDLTQAVSPGQASQLEFVADRPGIFEVELHDTRQVLTRLQIG